MVSISGFAPFASLMRSCAYNFKYKDKTQHELGDYVVVVIPLVDGLMGWMGGKFSYTVVGNHQYVSFTIAPFGDILSYLSLGFIGTTAGWDY